MSDILGHVRECLMHFYHKNGRYPSTGEEVRAIKNEAELMEIIEAAAVEPEFEDPNIVWKEA